MCRELMRVFASDGGKLELWKRWLGLAEPGDQTKGKQRDDDGSIEWPPAPPLEHVTAVLREKVKLSLVTFSAYILTLCLVD